MIAPCSLRAIRQYLYLPEIAAATLLVPAETAKYPLKASQSSNHHVLGFLYST